MQAAWERDDAFLGLIRLQKICARFLIHIHLLGAQISLELGERSSGLLICQQQLASRECVLQAPQHDGGIYFHGLAVQVHPQVSPQRVADFVFLRLESKDRLRSRLRGLSSLRRRRLLSAGGGRWRSFRRRFLLSLGVLDRHYSGHCKNYNSENWFSHDPSSHGFMGFAKGGFSERVLRAKTRVAGPEREAYNCFPG